MDMILNGVAHGSVASRLLNNNFDVGILRPYSGANGRTYVDVPVFNAQKGCFETKAVVTNAPSALRYDDWRLIDTAVLKAARQRLRLVADLRGSGLQHTIPNGMAKTVFSTEKMSDPGSASVSMDGLRKGEGDRPEFSMDNLPLPIIHSDFSFSARQIAVSRNSNTPIDTSMAEAAARRVAEIAEKMAIGSYGTYAFGGGTIYGLTNFPNRITKSLTAPTATGWTPNTTLVQILDMKQKSIDSMQYGPWILYCGTSWDQYLDNDYSAAKGDNTLRERIKKIEGINDVRTLDFLSGFQMVLVQQTTDTIREVVGLDFTTVQWEGQGGMEINYKVLAIMVPQIRADYYGKCGIVHGS